MLQNPIDFTSTDTKQCAIEYLQMVIEELYQSDVMSASFDVDRELVHRAYAGPYTLASYIDTGVKTITMRITLKDIKK